MKSRNFKFNNGDKVSEIITGFVGVITGTAFYITGCNQYLVAAKPKDEFSEAVSIWYDEGRLNLLEPSTFNSGQVKADNNEDGCDKLPPRGRRGY